MVPIGGCMMLHLYESHLGGLSWSDEEYEYEDLYCDSCGDSDSWEGQAENFCEALGLLSNQTWYDAKYLLEIANEAYAYFGKEEECYIGEEEDERPEENP